MSTQKKRLREYGFNPGTLPTGKRNTISDVAGVRVGHATKFQGEDVRTGITLIDPGIKDLFMKKAVAAVATMNGAGKVAGFTEVEEFGYIRAPLALTNTHGVSPVMQGVIDLALKTNDNLPFYASVNTVIGEVNDAILNDIHKQSLSPKDVLDAYEDLSEDFKTGCVGGGTGSRCFRWKGGIGTASRKVEVGDEWFTVGILVQTNYGGNPVMMGVPIGQLLGEPDSSTHPIFKEDGSCMIVLATDAPLTSRQLKRLAQRTFIGLGWTGSIIPNASGDYTIAFSTNRSGMEGSGTIGACLVDDVLNPLFLGAAEATAEAIWDALFLAETTTGRNGNTLEAMPVDEVVTLLHKHLDT